MIASLGHPAPIEKEFPHDDESDDDLIVTIFTKEHRPMLEEPIKLELDVGLPLQSISAPALSNAKVFECNLALNDNGDEENVGTEAFRGIAKQDSRVYGDISGFGRQCEQQIVEAETDTTDPFSERTTSDRDATNMNISGASYFD